MSSSRSSSRRGRFAPVLTTLAASAALVAAGLVWSPSVQAVSAPPVGPAAQRATTSGAAWVKAQLSPAGLIHNAQFAFDDYGLGIDAALALDAIGNNQATVNTIVTATMAKKDSYIEADEYGCPTPGDWTCAPGDMVFKQRGLYAGAMAKLAVAGQVAGQDVAGVITKLEQRVATTGPSVGRIDDSTSYGANLYVIRQSLAARALTVANSPRAADAMAFLLKQQCPGGGFREKFTADALADEQRCLAAADGQVDTTAFTVINLYALPVRSAEVNQAITNAVTWLKGQQGADGSVGASTNANTTGLAGWALGLAGETEAAGKAAAWIKALQLGDATPCATGLATENGGIAMTVDGLTAARTAKEITKERRDQWQRASFQALPALTYLPGTAALDIKAPATVTTGQATTFTVTGLAKAETGCVSFGGLAVSVTGTGSDLPVTITAPAAGSSPVEVSVVGAKVSKPVTVAPVAPVVTTSPSPTVTVSTSAVPSASASVAASASPTAISSASPPASPASPLSSPSSSTGAATVVAPALATIVRPVRGVVVRKGALRLRATCADVDGCTGTLAVRTARKVGGRLVPLTRTVTYKMKAGQTMRMSLQLTKRGERQLKRLLGLQSAKKGLSVSVRQQLGSQVTVTKLRVRSAR